VNYAHLIDDHPGDHVAIISRGRPTTYAALRDQVAELTRKTLTAPGAEPVRFSEASGKRKTTTGPAGTVDLSQVLPQGVAAFAAGLKFRKGE
jgi:hypothetical protein